MRWIEVRDREKVMPAIGMDDSEMSYRRGYQHGAAKGFRAVERFLDPATREVLRAWIEQDVYGWRVKGMLAYPPIWRLSNLKRSKVKSDKSHLPGLSTTSTSVLPCPLKKRFSPLVPEVRAARNCLSVQA